MFCLQLQRSQDGFSVVADYFGRGVFNKVRSRPLLYLENRCEDSSEYITNSHFRDLDLQHKLEMNLIF